MSLEECFSGAAPSLGAASVLVVGAGVSGLTTALLLRKAGARVTIVADRFAPQVTSVVAGALWEWPPAVCGSHHDPTSLARSKNWSALSYRIFTSLSKKCAAGVFLRPVTFYFREKIETVPLEFKKMNEFSGKVLEFRHDPRLIEENGVNPSRLRDAYRFLAPMVDTDVYMRWLSEEVRLAGVTFVQERITQPLLECEDELKYRYRADWIINCSGLGSRELARDNVYPLRGALVRLRNNINLREAHCVSHDIRDSDPYFIFILPRGENRVLAGGIAEENEWDTNLPLDHARVREMWRRCVEFFPALAKAEIDEEEPVRTGLRPLRPGNVRLEAESDSTIIHNYGHGGSGVTFSWGCAREIVERLSGKQNFTVPAFQRFEGVAAVARP
ncbi:MAG TPA: FAD-dependent oxidoreductase [Verrucomicrobiae bacterium]|nr:FAD-dependent oxidoreductase [Verrucomicrobiae bacterium]